MNLEIRRSVLSVITLQMIDSQITGHLFNTSGAMFFKIEKSLLKVEMVRRITKVTSDVVFLLIQLKFDAVLFTNWTPRLSTSPNV